MKIVMATSEAVPFAKTGGLADVCGALPLALEKLGHQPVLILPAYRAVYESGAAIQPTGVDFEAPIGSKLVRGSFLESRLPKGNVRALLVKQDDYYDRKDLYGPPGKDFPDNCERFTFFCRAAIEAIRLFDLRPDVLHCNDWQTGLIPAYLKIECRGIPPFDQIGTLFTIHNMAYQGLFWHWDMLLTGLDWKYFHWQQMEFYGNLNLLKTGLVFADRLSTVSQRYAEEIQSAPLGEGLEGVLHHRRDVLSGILNGVDYGDWNPTTDPHIPANYSIDDYAAGKAACKAALQAEIGLPKRPDLPLVALVGRLTEQKGIDLVAAVVREWVQRREVQWAILGTGEPAYHELFKDLAKRFPQRVGLRLGFDNALAHRLEAGADMFLMPSKYEPCGLNQMYSLKYGTVPVVRLTGGLADTIATLSDDRPPERGANGFGFREYSSLALVETLQRAVDTYLNQKDVWHKLILTGMRQDWSWNRSAEQYVDLYRQTAAQARGPLAARGA